MKIYKYVFIFTATRRIKRFSVDSLVRDVIDALDPEATESEIVKKLSGQYKREDISSCIGALEDEGIVWRYDPAQIKGQYDKQILFIGELANSWEETIALQRKIENSSIAVFGVGGIGTWIVNGLHQIGVGEIKISDPDTVEKSNLNRQLFFDSQDIGKYKVDVVKSKLVDAKIIPFKRRVQDGENLDDIVSGCNFLVNCADNPSVAETSRIIDTYARRYNVPYCVSGGYNLHLGMVGPIIVPGVTRSFNEFLEYQKRNDPLKGLKVIKDISQTGNLGPIAGAIANIQVMEIFKFLTGKGKVNFNRFAEVNFMDFGVEWRNF